MTDWLCCDCLSNGRPRAEPPAEPVSVYTVSAATLIPVEAGTRAVELDADQPYDPYDNRQLDHPTT